MKIERRDSSDERTILTAMIVDKVVLGAITQKWSTIQFRSKWANIVGEWCTDYYKKYEEAPKKSIRPIFKAWASDAKDDSTVELVEKFLSRLSKDYEGLEKESNSQYILDVSNRHFNRVRIEKLKEELEGDLESGQIERAEKRLEKSLKVEIGLGAGIDVMLDESAMKSAFEANTESIIKYPGAMGKFMMDALQRDAFVTFMGAEKRGKTWNMLDMAFRGMEQRRKVAFFEIGDLTQPQVMRRLGIRAARRPLKARKINYPLAITRDQDDRDADAEVEHEVREFKGRLDWKEAMKAMQKIQMKKVKSDQSYFKLSCHPTFSINVNGIESVMQTWERADWVPDIVLIDYADNLAAPYGVGEGRDAINHTWGMLRGLSQKWHCLVVTATQARRDAYTAKLIGREHTPEDKRKLAHCTGMIGLNSTPAEKELGVMRYNWVVLREEEFVEERCVYAAGCLSIGNPIIRTCW